MEIWKVAVIGGTQLGSGKCFAKGLRKCQPQSPGILRGGLLPTAARIHLFPSAGSHAQQAFHVWPHTLLPLSHDLYFWERPWEQPGRREQLGREEQPPLGRRSPLRELGGSGCCQCSAKCGWALVSELHGQLGKTQIPLAPQNKILDMHEVQLLTALKLFFFFLHFFRKG